MKKFIYIPATAMAALALITGGCTASDPDNGLEIDQVITDEDNDDSDSNTPTENPKDTYHLTSYRQASKEYRIAYEPVSWLPLSVSVYDSDNSNKEFTFTHENQTVTEIIWNSTEYAYEEMENLTLVKEGKLSNLQFEDGLLKGCSYSETVTTYNSINDITDIKTEAYTIAFYYDPEKHLTRIIANNQVFDQTWDDNGDLITINSPKYGKSNIQYSTVENRWLQWEPTLPFMGFFQTFGWFGTAPKHFPSSIAMTEGTLLDTEYTSAALDYYIDYNGTITQTSWKFSTDAISEAVFSYN